MCHLKAEFKMAGRVDNHPSDSLSTFCEFSPGNETARNTLTRDNNSVNAAILPLK